MRIVFVVMQQNFSIPGSQPEATEPEPVVSQQKPGSAWQSVLSTIAIFIAAPLVALFLISFVFQSYEVDGPSMQTTLQNHDRLIVWKVPRSVARITGHDYIPHRGDVIVFVKHGLSDPYGNTDKQLIKRVLGLPGDRVVVANGTITIYNQEHPNGFNPDLNHEWSGNIATVTTGDVDMVVPAGQVFVFGDNRTNSLDSRAPQIGPVPSKDIVGKLAFRIFPVNTFQSFVGTMARVSYTVR